MDLILCSYKITFLFTLKMRQTVGLNANSGSVSELLNKAAGIINDLREDNRRLKAELEMKDALFSKRRDVLLCPA